MISAHRCWNSHIFHQTIPVTSSNGLDIHLFEAILDRQGNREMLPDWCFRPMNVQASTWPDLLLVRDTCDKNTYLPQKVQQCNSISKLSDIPSEPPILVFQSYYSVYLCLVIPSHSLTEKNPRAQTCFTSKRGRSKEHAICNSRFVIEAALTFTCCVSSHVGYNDILICGLAASHANHRSLQVVVMHFFKHLVYNI